MPADMFLKLDGIAGESLDSKHKGEIEIESFSWGAANSGSAAHGGGGAGAGKVSMQDFHFVARTSKASPQLFLACASGKRITSGTLTVRRAGEQQLEFLKVTMTEVVISGWKQEGNTESDLPQEQVSMNFAKVKVDYTEQSRAGSAGETTSAGWDVKANVKL
jgi:type VI secretion system secreted protein Hcp